MSFSAASTGSKRSAVEDDTVHSGNERSSSKRLKPARKTSPNGDQTCSKYLTEHQPKNRSSRSSPESQNQANESHSVLKDSTRKDRSISPPTTSPHKAPSKTAGHRGFKSPQPDSSKNKNKNDSNIDDAALVIAEHIGDIFDAPPNSLLIHACNCKGYWGKGIAAAFRENYPAAFKIYKAHCAKPDKQLIGTALLIPPQPEDSKGHHVGCVFTSVASGFRVDSPSKILDATGPAMNDLLTQARNHVSKGKGDILEVRMCKINSGLFKVKWEDTREVLETRIESHGFQQIDVFERSEG